MVTVTAVTGERVGPDGSVAPELSTIIVPVPIEGFTALPAYDKVGWHVILAIPFGFGLPFLIKMNWKKIALSTMLFSLLLELLQLTAHLILPGHNRMVDINDLIYNTLGGIIGYALYKLFAKIFKIIISKYDIEMNSVLAYVQKTVSTD